MPRWRQPGLTGITKTSMKMNSGHIQIPMWQKQPLWILISLLQLRLYRHWGQHASNHQITSSYMSSIGWKPLIFQATMSSLSLRHVKNLNHLCTDSVFFAPLKRISIEVGNLWSVMLEMQVIINSGFQMQLLYGKKINKKDQENQFCFVFLVRWAVFRNLIFS